MGFKNRVRQILKNKNRAYIIARCINDLNNPRLIQLMKGYFGDSHDYVSIILEHKGTKYPDEIVYGVRFRIPNDKTSKRDGGGFCALLRMTLLGLNFPDYLKMTPVVEWGSNSAYYDPDMDSITLNVFEYYFKPVSKIRYNEIEECRNVVAKNSFDTDSYFFMDRASDMGASYLVKQDEIERLGYLYKKYIHLNQTAKEYIEGNLDSILNQGTILAVHVRGTDFNVGYRFHPMAISVDEYLAKAKETYSRGNYDKVFLATDDDNALELFKQEFKDKLLYYTDVFRSHDHIGAHVTPSNRQLHYYRLGLEVLRDVYTLANCDSLVCGLSNVSFVARYINIALDRKFKEIVILDHGVHAEASSEAKERNRQQEKIFGRKI